MAKFNLLLVCLTTAAVVCLGATPINISVSPNAFGGAQITWPSVPGAASYVATVSPFAHTYDWSTPLAAIPDPVSWTLDNRQDVVRSGFSFDTAAVNPRLVLLINGNSTCVGSSTLTTYPVRCPMMYRRAPPSPAVSVPVNITAAAAALPNVMAGVVVFNARNNAPLAQCVVRSTGSTYTVGLWARGAWVGAPLTTPDGPSWGPGVAPLVQLSHTTGATTGGWVCSAKTLVSTPWASAASVTASDSALDGFAEGDLYYGVVAQSWGAPATTTAPVYFGTLSFTTSLSTLTAPIDPQNNSPDRCFSGVITPVATILSSSANATSFSGLPSNFPLVVSLVAYAASGGTGAIVAQSPVYPFFYARPYPPGWESLGLFVDSKYLSGTINKLYDVSPNKHVLSATATSLPGNYPTAGTTITGLSYTPSTFTATSNLLFLKRTTATGFVSDARDSIGLGFGTNTGYTIYAFATMSTLAAEQFLVARGQTNTGLTAGWSLSYFYGAINGAPLDVNGSMGLRTLDGFGNAAGAYYSAGIKRFTPQVYTYVASPTNPILDGGLRQWFASPNITGALDAAYLPVTPGFAGTGPSSVIQFPIAVNQGIPSVTNTLALSLGVPPATTDTTRAWDGQIYSVMIFRAAHTPQQVASVTDWINTYYQRKCSATLSPPEGGNSWNSAYPPNCSAGKLTTDTVYAIGTFSYHCFIGCRAPAYTTLAMSQGHTCIGGSWSNGGTLCRRSCPAVAPPANFLACEQTLWYESFSFNDTSMLGNGGGNAAARSFNFSAWSTTGLQDPFNNFIYPYRMWPTVSDATQQQMWTIDTVAGILRANTNNACAKTTTSMIGLTAEFFNQNNIFRVQYATPTRVIAVFRLLSNTSSAGVLLRTNGIGNHYRFAVYPPGYTMTSPPTGFSLGFAIERRTGGNINQFISLVRNSSASVSVGVWYTIDATITQTSMSAGLYVGSPQTSGAVGAAVVANLTQLAFLSTADSSITAGGVAIYADGLIDFDTFSVRTSCQVGGTCANSYDGGWCDYSCNTGFYNVQTTTMCGRMGTVLSTGSCRAYSPTFPSGQQVFVNERSQVSAQASPAVVATVLSSSIPVTFFINSQGPAPYNDTFTIGLCSGYLFVNNAANLVLTNVPTPSPLWVNVSAMSNLDPSTAVWSLVNVTLLPVPLPPSFNLTTLSAGYTVAEQWVGTLSPNVVAMDPQNLPLTYSIAFASFPGITIDDATGALYIASPGLNYLNIFAVVSVDYSTRVDVTTCYLCTTLGQIQQTGSPVVVNLIVTATEVGGTGLSASAPLAIVVTAVPKPPTITPGQVLSVDEFHCFPGSIVGGLAASSPYFAIANYSISSNPLRPKTCPCLPALDIDPSSGQVTMAISLSYGPDVQAFVWNGYQVKDYLNASATVCDVSGLCSTSTFFVIVTPNVTAGLQPVITGLNFAPSPTSGNASVTFIGQYFVFGSNVNATYVNRDGVSYAAIGCAVQTGSTAIVCYTVPGYGGTLSWTVTMSGTVLSTVLTAGLQTSYIAPVLLGVTQTPNGIFGFPTAGSTSVSISGSGFGPPGTPVVVSYAYSSLSAFSLTNAIVASDSVITGLMGPGCGANLAINVALGLGALGVLGGENIAATSAAPNATVLSYSPPLNDWSATAAPHWTVTPASGLLTLGGNTISLKCSDPSYTHCYFGPNNAQIVVTLTSAIRGVSVTATCANAPGSQSHSLITCANPAGVGKDWIWSVQVCGQASPPCTNAPPGTPPGCGVTAYDPPGIFSVSGPGVTGAHTEGGESIIIYGTHFGPLWTSGISTGNSPVDYVKYGPASQPLKFTATGCSVSGLGAYVTCLSSPGYGGGPFTYTVSLGGQNASISNVVGSGYGAPVIASITGPEAVDADTAGAPRESGVVVSGYNFGATYFASTQISYTLVMHDDTATTGVIPFGGNLTFWPSCNMSIPHYAFMCSVPPGGGTNLVWRVVVGGQVNVQPSTSYARPTVSSVVLPTGVTSLSTTGGQNVTLIGADFGLPGLLQDITYGPITSTEYIVQNWTWNSHTSVSFITVPGVGAANSFIVTVADQVGPVSAPLISYTGPTVQSVVPAAAGTFSDPASPTSITVSGLDFGLSHRFIGVVIAFGNVDDGTLKVLPITGRTPSFEDVTQADFVPVPGQTETVTFSLPQGLGSNRAVRVVPYLQSQGQPTMTAILATTTTASFSYFAPVVSMVGTDPVPADSAAQADCLASGMCTITTPLGSVRRLEITGSNFGPSQDVTGDTVGRYVEVNSSGVWSRTSALFPSANWSHTFIEAFTQQSGGSLRITLELRDPSGALYTISSNATVFGDYSPVVTNVDGVLSNVPTIGGPVITITAQNLASASTLSVTVGGNQAILVDSNGHVIDPSQAAAIIVGTGSFPANYNWTIWAVIPPGQGTNQAVQVLRNGIPSARSWGVSYMPPSLSGWQSCTNPSSCGPQQDLGFGVIVSAPTAGGRVRLLGTNLGVCPTVFAVTGWVPACFSTADGGYSPNPDVVRNHTYIEFPILPGEGKGPSPGTPFSIIVNVGDQVAPWIAFSYASPVITSLSPQTAPTVGGTTLSISGYNFGQYAPPSIFLGHSPAAADLINNASALGECTNVARINDTLLTCTLPEGAGAFLGVYVTVANLTGCSASGPTFAVGPSFSYLPPTITGMSRSYASTRGTTPAPAWVNTSGTLSVTLDGHSQLSGSTTGGYLLTVTGTNLGPWPVGLGPSASESLRPMPSLPSGLGSLPSISCACVSWSGALDAPTCDGFESFLGEGEVATPAIVAWSHTSVSVWMPAGIGLRTVSVYAGGQAPTAGAYANFIFDAPIVFSTSIVGHRDSAFIDNAIDADGGTLLELTGWFFPRPFLKINTSTFPLPLPLPSSFIMPTESLIVQWGLTCSYDPLSPPGLTLPGTNCTAASTTAAVATSHSDSRIVFTVPPGLGSNRKLTVQVWEPGFAVAVSAPLTLAYEPPVITSINPQSVYVSDYVSPTGYTSTTVTLLGRNMGRQADSRYWEAGQGALTVTVNGVLGANPGRVVFGEGDTTGVSFLLPNLVVGYTNVTLTVAGQNGTLGTPSPDALLIACSYGFFGHPGEACLACPIGASCPGYVGGSSAPTTSTDGRTMTLVSGIHYYPIPLPGFFNLNDSLAGLCPESASVLGRDVCIVGCSPPGACAGANFCSEGYANLPPTYRCGSCDKGYYSNDGRCIKCSNSQVAIVVVIALVIIACAGVGYFLSQKNVNLAFLSIGVDYFQVLAMFAAAQILWPAPLANLWNILSAFNFNINIVAPECLVPNVSYIQKWSVFEAIPFLVAVCFLLIHGILLAYKRYFLQQRSWEVVLSHVDVLVSSFLTLFFFLFLQLLRMQLEVFDCGPLNPPDGNLYLLVVFEKCGIPGGVQMTLLPWAIITLLGYSVAYPAFLSWLYWKNHERIMEDQLLRAKGGGDDRLTNPNAYHLRRRYARTYYQFRPDTFFWSLAVLLRKACIALVNLFFRRSANFQLAAILLVMFLAYTAQVKFVPYMSPSEFDEVLARHQEASFTSRVHARLRATLQAIELRGRKPTRRNVIFRDGKFVVSDFMRAVGEWLNNYNTVESVLLFSCVLVALGGTMYLASYSSQYYNSAASTDAITALLIFIIAASMAYYVSVLLTELTTKLMESQAAAARAKVSSGASKSGRKLKSFASSSALPTEAGKSVELSKGAAARAGPTTEVNIGKTENMMNPLFLSAGGKGGMSNRSAHEAIMASLEPPAPELWSVFRDSYAGLQESAQASADQLASAKLIAERSRDLLEAAGVPAEQVATFLKTGDLSAVSLATSRRGAAQPRQAVRTEFRQISTGGMKSPRAAASPASPTPLLIPKDGDESPSAAQSPLPPRTPFAEFPGAIPPPGALRGVGRRRAGSARFSVAGTPEP